MWLGERGVAIQSLQLMDNNVYGIDALNTSNVRLLAVESISWTCSQYLSSELVEAVLRVCPNLTHLRLGQSVSISPAITALLPKLKSITKHAGSRKDKDKKLESMLTAFGPQLQELRILNGQIFESMLQFMCDECSQLQVLELQLFRAGYDPCLRLLQSCKQLSELVVHAKGSDLDPTEIAKIAAYPQLQRLTVRSSALGHASRAVFAHVREVRPDLQYLNIGGWSYSAPEGSLSVYLSAGAFDPTLVAGVLGQCPVKELMVNGIHLDGEMAKLIVKHLPGGPLESLNVSAQDSNSLKLLLCKFGSSLKHISSGYAGITDEQLRFIGTQCQLLKSIVLNSCGNVSDEGVISLLTGCPLLKTVSMNRVPLTNETLHAIITNKLRLKALALFACGLDNSSAEWFRQQVIEHQLLPMPEIKFS